MQGDLRGYVLAGGKSSRMGVDKAEMRLGGRTLLEIAVGKLRRFTPEVVVVGERADVPEGVRVIADLRPRCGPLGGMEAALVDAGERSAIFVPVDMPFVPAGLLEKLAEDWSRSEARACFAVADGRVQPLLSLLRPGMLPEVRRTLDRGRYKVEPVFEEALEGGGGVWRSVVGTANRTSVWAGWLPSDAEWAERELWFRNLNTAEEFRAAASLAFGRREL